MSVERQKRMVQPVSNPHLNMPVALAIVSESK
jgi:hypothetical protein